MRMSNKAPQVNEKTVSEIRNCAVSFAGKLDSGELLAGTPSVIDSATPSPQTITISSVNINTEALTINGESVPAGEAVQFTVAGGTANTVYTLQASCGTDSSPAQALYGSLDLEVTPDS
jgi:hypothetical protein